MNQRLKSIFVLILVALFCAAFLSAQKPGSGGETHNTLVQIMRAEDELRFDGILAAALRSKDGSVRKRAALAAGRIGDEAAIPRLVEMMLQDTPDVAQMAAFAIGEIESTKGTESVLKILKETSRPDLVRARAAEAAGKIAGANSMTDDAKALGAAVLDNLEFENRRSSKQSRDVILLGITAVLRSKPDEGDYVLSKFMTNMDARVRTDTANALARLNTKKYTRKSQAMLLTDEEPLARANAARALGAANDKTAVNLLLGAALTDDDLRVRVNAINALGRIGESATGSQIMKRAESLLNAFQGKTNTKRLNELLTLSGALGQIMEGTNDTRTVEFLNRFRILLRHTAPEVEVALVRISPQAYFGQKLPAGEDWRASRSIAAALGFAADIKDSPGAKELRAMAAATLKTHLIAVRNGKKMPDMSYPAILNAYARHKPDDLAGFLREALKFDDVVVREAAASLLGDQEIPKSSSNTLENYFALRDAYNEAERDKLNDAALASLTAIKKQYLKLKANKDIKVDLLDPIKRAAISSDYLVRRRARAIAKEIELNLQRSPERVNFNEKGASRLKRFDYKIALARKNASAILTTTKGKFEIKFFPEAAPMTVHNFISLAKSGYFNGLAIHRVVPNFVVQDGDPRGDGSGGPGWHIRCEINQIPYERGTVGMALSGKDTGGSQWFVAHSPQPHLDGGYTVFGKVNESNMKIVDRLVRGDVVQNIEIIE